MATPDGGAGRRRISTSTSRARRSAVAVESNENDDIAAAPSSSSSSAFAPTPALHFSLPPRSPLAAIADPGRNPRSAPVTPKSLAGAPRGCAVGSGARDRTSAIGASRRVFDLAAAEVPVEVPHFELDEDPAFWKDRNVQVLIRIRPISDAENATHGQKRCLMQDSSKSLSWTGHPETMFTFDHVACETISQEKLFRVVGLPMVENCMSGYNGCLFTYGQTGSGKTYTMMGELTKLGDELSKDSGLTPRIFEYLFARINEEEERRREEKLKYTCKCSFLEIYNEQITDLLEPSSTNLQIREDIKKGVYVENLMECHVPSVKDVMQLLLQGVANRKMAATNMNSESSRSHSVFTCVIESRWESDSMTHLRFGRLNLVDLAGSERQKSSGAEGERLREAANINRSLSTLGLVIMTLVDVANGKSRHVPYRDSRLTFILQDSLGGNSKTTIVANVSPSICSSSETLSTLKFAQRAKLIQNNAKVNEDASGDVMALQRQIEELKDQLTCLKKQQVCPGSPSFQLLNSGFANEFKDLYGIDDQPDSDLNILKEKVSHLEEVLIGSLRREKSAETKIGKLEDEIKHLNRLVNLMESDAQRMRSWLKIQHEKLRMDENAAFSQEIQLLHEQVNENPQLAHFALENKRLIDELRMLQNFYKQGEREMLLTEISLLRNHFLHILEQKYTTTPKNLGAQGDEIIKELDNCRKELDACLENNVLLAREINKLRCELIQYQKSSTNEVAPETKGNVAYTSINPIQHDQIGHNFSYLSSVYDADEHFMEAGTTANITESFQVDLPYEIDSEDLESHLQDPERHDFKDPATVSEYAGALPQSFNLAREPSHDVLDKFSILNGLNFVEKDGISHDLEHLKKINQELKEKLDIMTEDSNKLSEIIIAKDVEIASLSEEWEAAIFDLTSFLTDGCRSLDDAYQNIDHMISSFPHINSSVSEHVEKAMKVTIEKEKMIFKLQIELQAAQKMGREVKEKLHILRSATLAITEAHQLDSEETTQEALQQAGLLHQKDSMIQELKDHLEEEKFLFTETAERYPHDDLSHDSSADMPQDETGSEVSKSDPDNQLKISSVLHFVEDKSNKVLTLFSNFEEAQETMEEAELMLSALLKTNKELKLERDDCRQAVESLTSEKDSLIDELKELEASSSYTSQRYDKLHRQIHDCVAEMAKLVALIRGLFQQIQSVTTAELFTLCSEIIKFGQDLKRCISDSRSYLVNMVSLVEEKGRSSNEQFHHLNSNARGYTSQQVESCSCLWNGRKADIGERTQVIQGTTSTNHMIDMAEKEKELPSSSSDLEDSNKISMHDMTAVNDIVSSIAHQWDVFIDKVSSIKNARANPSAAYDERIMNPFAALEKLGSVEICSAAPLQCEGSMEGYQRDQDSSEHLLNDIKRLRDHLAQLIMPMLAFMNNIVTMGDGQEKMLQNCHQETVNVTQLISVLKNMSNNLNFVIDLFVSLVLSGREGFQTMSLLSNIIHEISNIEKKVIMLQKIQLHSDSCPADNTADYASLRKEFDRKNNIAEGLSFDLKLLQESTSNAKDMKDKANEISTALSNVQRELEMKSSAMENLLKKQKALEEELAENGAGLVMLRSELEQSQSLSSALLKENKELRVMLEEESLKNNETKVLLEDKVRVIEGLESQILLLNCSEVGQLMSDIEELNNSLKITSSTRENLQAEILQLRDKLEMAMALAEENEAAAIEARQTAETSKIYAEEKEEEVKILERSVEELEATITVLEEEVCNLKEEVRSYQLHKQSEAECQALDSMLFVENASECDAHEELCQGKCRLEKRLHAEVIAHQNVKKKIEGLKLEAKRKDEEIRQYKEHIAELVLHSEAQSLLFQEKYQEMEHMVSKHKFGSHESSSETVHAKVEKPSGRARGSGSPFRCISSIMQQMNSEKDQEISMARQRIEELEGLLNSKQKEICLLTSRLAAVDTMTHDIIRELLGVKLDMTNYANLVDQEEVHKLLIASQQQIEQSKLKDAELEVLKEQLGRLTLERDSLLDDVDQRKTCLLESQLLVEELEQREQMLEAQIQMLQMEKDNLQQKIMEMDETIELFVRSNQPNSTLQMDDNQNPAGSSEFSRRLAQSDMLLSQARHEHHRSHASRSSRTDRCGRLVSADR